MLSDDDIRELVEAGACAPTGGNAQPWRVRATNDTLEISLDDARSSSFIDVDRSSSLLGVGSLVENIVVAARSRGLEPNVDLIGLTHIEEPVARITFEPGNRIDEPAAGAIRKRATNRHPWNHETISQERIARVAARTATGGAHRLLTASGGARSGVANALAEADVVRTFNRAYQEGMQSEFRWTADEAESTRDGIDVTSLELSAGDRRGLELMRKRWFVSLFVTRNRIREMARKALLDSSHLAAIVMPDEASAVRLLEAGRAVQRCWLAATMEGLSIHPWCTIPFFNLRAERYPDSLPERDEKAIRKITDSLKAAWGVAAGERIIFTFRLSIVDRQPSAIALRRPWTDFTTVDRES